MSAPEVFPDLSSIPEEQQPTWVVPYDAMMAERVRKVIDHSSFPLRLALRCSGDRWEGSTRSAPRFLDSAWEEIQRARVAGCGVVRVLGLGPHTEQSILRYPWDAVIAPDGVPPHVLRAYAARWRSRWWP